MCAGRNQSQAIFRFFVAHSDVIAILCEVNALSERIDCDLSKVFIVATDKRANVRICIDSLNTIVGALSSEQQFLQISIVSERRDHVAFASILFEQSRLLQRISYTDTKNRCGPLKS